MLYKVGNYLVNPAAISYIDLSYAKSSVVVHLLDGRTLNVKQGTKGLAELLEALGSPVPVAVEAKV